MPSGAKKRKAKKKKQAGEAHSHSQHHGNKEDSGNEQEHEQEQDHGHEEDPITPKTPVKTNEGEEKEKSEVEGGLSDAEEVGSLDRGFNQTEENRTQTSFQEVESTDINLAIPENGNGGLENEVDVSSGGAFEDKDGPIGNLGTEEGHSEATPARTSSLSSSSSSSSHHVSDDGDEIQHDEKETKTDESDLNVGDESEVSSSKLEVSEENEPNRTLGQSTLVNETSPSAKDDDEELESSDGDESKLDVVSTMATLDANESIQSVGSVDSPRSVYSQQYSDQVSNERPELASQDQDRGSEGFSETPFQELGTSETPFSEPGDKPVYKLQVESMEFPQEEDFPENSLTEESLKGLRDENIQVSAQVVSDNHALVMEELTQIVAELDKIEVQSSVSLATFNEESEAIPKVDENDAKESVMPLSKSESVNTRHISVVSTSGEAGEKVVSTGEAIGDAISSTEKANEDVVSAGGAGKEAIGSIKYEGTSADPNDISCKEIALHPRNGTNEKKINLPQTESRTSWLSCCGIIDLFTSARS